MNTAEFRSLTDYEIDFVAGGGFSFSMPLMMVPHGFTTATVQTAGSGWGTAEAAAVPGMVAISIAQAGGLVPADAAFATATAEA